MTKSRKMVERLTVSEDELFEMANLSPEHTGLRQMVWFSGDPTVKHHRPRGKIRVDQRFYPFSLNEPVQWLIRPAPRVSAKDFDLLTQFVRLNGDRYKRLPGNANFSFEFIEGESLLLMLDMKGIAAERHSLCDS